MYSGKSKDELIALCKERKIKGYSGKKKDDIIALIIATEGNLSVVTSLPDTSRKSLSPIVKWSGGKSDEIKNILKHIPEHKVYVEPFVGGGALYFHLNPQNAIINDIHPELIALYRTIGEGNVKNIKEFMEAHPNEEDEYYRVRSIDPQNDIEKACQFYYLRKTCFRGMLRYNKDGKFNIPYGKYKTINYTDLDNSEYETLLRRTTIMNGHFRDVFEACNTGQEEPEDHFIFLDPPYDSEFKDYGYCSFGKEEHEELAKLFKTTRAKCLMVIGETDFINKLYEGYIVEKYPKKYKFKIHSGRVGDEINVNHLVIRNW
jgi:DNA adenine methylase